MNHAVHMVVFVGREQPALVLTRPEVQSWAVNVTVAPVTFTPRGMSTELALVPENGVGETGAVSCENITTVPAGNVGRRLGRLTPDQETALTRCVSVAFDLEVP